MDISIQISKAEKYPAKQHAQRVAAKLGATEGLIYLLGQYAYDKEDSDMPKTWYQRRFFYYLSGVDEPNACLTYNLRTGELVLYIEEIDWDKLIWTGRGSTVDEARERYDVDDVRLNPQLFPDIRKWLKEEKGAHLYALHEEQVPKDIDGLKERLEFKTLMPIIDECRAIKDSHEIKLIRRANEISNMAHCAVLEKLASAKNEAELSAVFQDVCIASFAVQAYAPIVGSGPNASTLHYTANNESLRDRQLICLDAGAAEQLYASDVTRTFPVNGQWTAKGKQIYSLVEKMQETSIAMCKPGTHMLDLHRHCHFLAVKGLLDLGILHNGTAKDILASGVSMGFYPHGLGHHLGLETHDCQSLPILRYAAKPASRLLPASTSLAPCRSDSPALAAGMVITIEPGIYFNRQHLERNYLSKPELAKYINKKALEEYYPVGGVRIEDDILITKSGYENLTTTPKGEDALEIIREGFDYDLYAKVEDWHGLDHRSFGRLRKFATVKASTDPTRTPAVMTELRAYLFDSIFLLVQEVHDQTAKTRSQSQVNANARAPGRQQAQPTRQHHLAAQGQYRASGPSLEHLGMTDCSVDYQLRGSLLVKEHLINVERTPNGGMGLELSTKDNLPDFHLQFETEDECSDWQLAFGRLIPGASGYYTNGYPA